MKTKFLVLIILIGAIHLTSCSPIPTSIKHYYRPEAENGRNIRYLYGHHKDTLKFSKDGVEIYLKTQSDWIHLDYYVPQGKEVRMASNLIKVTHLINENTYDAHLYEKTGFCRGRASNKWKKNPNDIYFCMHTIIKWPFSEGIKFNLPTFYINNEPWDLPEITIIKVKYLHFWSMPID